MRFRECYKVILFLTALTPTIVAAHEEDKCVSAESALAVANADVAKRWPEELEPPYPKPALKDAKDLWMVIYDLPEGYTGGAPTYFIEKKTCKIVQIISGQ